MTQAMVSGDAAEFARTDLIPLETFTASWKAIRAEMPLLGSAGVKYVTGITDDSKIAETVQFGAVYRGGGPEVAAPALRELARCVETYLYEQLPRTQLVVAQKSWEDFYAAAYPSLKTLNGVEEGYEVFYPRSAMRCSSGSLPEETFAIGLKPDAIIITQVLPVFAMPKIPRYGRPREQAIIFQAIFSVDPTKVIVYGR